MEDRCLYKAIKVCILFIFCGCNSPFYRLSKKISYSYDDKSVVKRDLGYNHPIRIKIIKSGLINKYNIEKDTIVFAQYIDVHNGDAATLVVFDRKMIFTFNDTSDYGQTDKETFSPVFLDALVRWDTTQINMIPQENSIHKGVIFITRIVNGNITVLKPRSYEMNQ